MKFHVLVVQNNGKEMNKKVWCTCKVVILLIRKKSVLHVQSCFFFCKLDLLLLFFTVVVAFSLSLVIVFSITRFYISLRNI